MDGYWYFLSTNNWVLYAYNPGFYVSIRDKQLRLLTINSCYINMLQKEMFNGELLESINKV